MIGIYTHATGCFVRDSVEPDLQPTFPFPYSPSLILWQDLNPGLQSISVHNSNRVHRWVNLGSIENSSSESA
jgi:hypothetical protein